MRRLSRVTVTIAIVAILVVSTIGIGAAAAGTTSSQPDDDADEWIVDVTWQIPGEDSSITVDTSTTTDAVTSVQSIIDDVFSSVFDTLDRGDNPGDEGDSSDDAESDNGDVDDADSEDWDSEAGDDESVADDEDGSSEPVDNGADETDGADGDDAEDETSDPVDEGDETDDSDADSDDRSDGADDADTDDSEPDADDSKSDIHQGDDSSESVDDESTDTVDDDADNADDETDDGSAGDANDRTLDRALVERYVHEAVNEERTDRGLEALAFDEDLGEIARAHSEDMAERGYFAHTDPDGNSFADRYEAHGYECRAYTDDGYYYTGGENLALTYFDQPVRTNSGEVVRHTDERELAYGIVDQWMNSDGHRENILAEHWNNEGIGIYVTDDDEVYATQNFC